jgi:hypothetical protein
MPGYEAYLDKDQGKVGAMLRTMTGDVAKAFQETLKSLYTDDDGNLTSVGESCCRWHWTIVKVSPDPYIMRKYVAIIQTAYEYNINLDKLPSWKRMIRIILPEEFLSKMKTYTQVPQIAIMDETKILQKKTGGREASGVLW